MESGEVNGQEAAQHRGIIRMLHEAEVDASIGMSVVQAVRKLAFTVQTYYSWRR